MKRNESCLKQCHGNYHNTKKIESLHFQRGRPVRKYRKKNILKSLSHILPGSFSSIIHVFYIFSYCVGSLLIPDLGTQLSPTNLWEGLESAYLHRAQNWTDTSCLSQQQRGKPSSPQIPNSSISLVIVLCKHLFALSHFYHMMTPLTDQHCLSSKHATVAS